MDVRLRLRWSCTIILLVLAMSINCAVMLLQHLTKLECYCWSTYWSLDPHSLDIIDRNLVIVNGNCLMVLYHVVPIADSPRYHVRVCNHTVNPISIVEALWLLLRHLMRIVVLSMRRLREVWTIWPRQKQPILPSSLSIRLRTVTQQPVQSIVL
jgi:hypothetical protein